MLQKTPFWALEFDIFLEEHDPGPLWRTYIIVDKLASVAESTTAQWDVS